MKKISKEVKEARLLYGGIGLLFIIIVLLTIFYFIPSLITTRPITPSQQNLDLEKMHELLDAPASNDPVEVSSETLENLEARKERVVPSQDLMDMLSAPPPAK